MLEREICPYGQRYNAFGQCELYLRECKVGYVLNARADECIPEPGFHLPFAFLYGALGWTIYILRRGNRRKMSRVNLVSQLLVGFTGMQQLSYCVQLVLAHAIGFQAIAGLHTFAMMVNYVLNVVCLLAVHGRI